MIFDRRFDLIISIGEDCACASYLQRFNLRDASYPFDWLCHATFEKRIELIADDFCGFMEKPNLRWFAKPATGLRDLENDNYEDMATGFYFYHDFREGVPLDDTYDAVNEKYQRRIARLYRNVARAKNVLFVWWTRDKDISCETLMDSQKVLSRKFQKDICLLALQNDTGGRTLIERPGEFVIRVKAPLTDAEGSTMGNREVCDSIFSQIALSWQRVLAKKRKKILENVICAFIPFKSLRKQIRYKIREM